jgi:hypothetical protein
VEDGHKRIRPGSAEGGIGLVKMDHSRDRRPIRPVFREVGGCNLGSRKPGDCPEIIGGPSAIGTADCGRSQLIVAGGGPVQHL